MSEPLPVPQHLLHRIAIALWCAVVFFVLTTIQGLQRPGFDFWHQAVSALSLGPGGWIQMLNLAVFGAVITSTAPVWRRILYGGKGATTYPLLTALVGLSFIALAIFPQDPAPGYDPAGLALTAPTPRGLLHLAIAGIAALSSIIGLCIMAARFAGDSEWRGWTMYSLTMALLVVVCVAVFAVWSRQASGFAGTFERLALVIPIIWTYTFWLRLKGGALFMKVNSPVVMMLLSAALLITSSIASAQVPAGQLPVDRSRPVPPRSAIIDAWLKRQDAIRTFRFVWNEQQVHPKGWIGNPRYPERERLAIPGLTTDRSYVVAKTLTVDRTMMHYSFDLNRREDPRLGVARHYSYVSKFDGQKGEARFNSMTRTPPGTIRRSAANVDAQNLDTRAILLAFRPADAQMGHVLIDRTVTNLARTFYRGRSIFLLEERHDPSGWKTILWIEPERDFLISRISVLFEQNWIVDMDIDYRQDAQWGWIPSAWRITEMLSDGSRRLVSTATVTAYSINTPIAPEQFRIPHQ